MYKFVVFDLDGTLANTLLDLANAVNRALEFYGLPTHDIEKYNKFVGNGISNLISQVLGDKSSDRELHSKVKQYFDDYYPKHLCDFTEAYQGMSELLCQLKSLGIKTAVHSNKPHIYVPEILAKLYPEHKFELAWGQQEQYERKPSPQALIAMMQQLSVKPEEVIYVGDSDVDVITAHSAGVDVCGVEWGFRGRAELESAGADFIAKNSEELYEIIKGDYEQKLSERA